MIKTSLCKWSKCKIPIKDRLCDLPRPIESWHLRAQRRNVCIVESLQKADTRSEIPRGMYCCRSASLNESRTSRTRTARNLPLRWRKWTWNPHSTPESQNYDDDSNQTNRPTGGGNEWKEDDVFTRPALYKRPKTGHRKCGYRRGLTIKATVGKCVYHKRTRKQKSKYHPFTDRTRTSRWLPAL